MRWIFASAGFAASTFSFWNCFPESKIIPYSVYFILSIIITPLLLTYFMITISFLFIKLIIIFFSFLVILSLQYFLHEFIFRNIENVFKSFWKKCSNSVKTAFFLALSEYGNLIHMTGHQVLLVKVHRIKSCVLGPLHYVKSARNWSYSGLHFPHSDRIRRDRLSLRIQFECGKMRTRITPNTDTFHAVRLANIFMVEIEILLF